MNLSLGLLKMQVEKMLILKGSKKSGMWNFYHNSMIELGNKLRNKLGNKLGNKLPCWMKSSRRARIGIYCQN